ncbi:MAG: AMP-binding protein [bacterium]|nr:AMP-binding protein [bacterium]
MGVNNPDPVGKYQTLVGLLQHRAEHQPDRLAYRYLLDGDEETLIFTHTDLDRKAKGIAAKLQALKTHGPALLLFPPGPEYLCAFFGCLYAGIVAIPAYPPNPARLQTGLSRLQALLKDSQADLILTTGEILAMKDFMAESLPEIKNVQWVQTDEDLENMISQWKPPSIDENSLAFLQYTSGSTSQPRGVMLKHGNLLHNLENMAHLIGLNEDSIGVSWLPPYHDMGLIGGILEPLYAGFPGNVFSPLHFLADPLRWMRAISKYGATVSGGPNFAYELCARKATEEEIAKLDLSSWDKAFNGAEPVRKDTLELFYETFKKCGFQGKALFPTYGLAESTLIVSGSACEKFPRTISLDKEALERHQVILGKGDNKEKRDLVSCGKAPPAHKIVIVNPETFTECPEDQVGEIWVQGPSVVEGYWNRPEESKETFQAFLADTGEGPFLRTGDLGFLRNGELFPTGRIKDLIILRGKNYYPQDIEKTMETSHPALRLGSGAAFSVNGNAEERLILAQEVYTDRLTDPDEVIKSIRESVMGWHDIKVSAVVLLEPKSIHKTSSGKIQRRACKKAYLAGSLNTVALWEEKNPLKRESPTPKLPAEELGEEEIKVLLVDHLSNQLGLEPKDIDEDKAFIHYGLDSIQTVGLLSELYNLLGRNVPIEKIISDFNNVNALARYLAREVNSEV